MTVKLKSSGWELGGEYLPWVWGQINYWDIERTRWHDVLKTYHLSGHRVVSTNVLPSVHQVSDQEYDFGKTRPQRDLCAFLNEAREIGLKVFLWVGPRDCPGVAAAGYPLRLLEDESALARDAKGNAVLSSVCAGKDIFTLPNLISEKLVSALQPFAIALKQAVHAQIHPDGPVIGMGLTQAPGWGSATEAFAADYSSETVSYYQAFLKKKYSKVINLNKTYQSDYTSFQGVHPPQSLENAGQFPEPRLLDWAGFREDYFVQAAERLHGVFNEIAGEKIPVFLSMLPTADKPLNLVEMEKSRCFSYALPGLRGQDGKGFRAAAQSRFLLSHDTLFSDETAQAEELRFGFMQGIAAGVRGWDAVSPAGAGRHPGFITNRQGVPVREKQACWELFKEFNAADQFLQSQIYGDILLLGLPEFERAYYLQKGYGVRMDLLEAPLLPEGDEKLDPDTLQYLTVYRSLNGFLKEQQYPFLETEADAPMDRLSKAVAVMLPSVKQMDASIQQMIGNLVEKGIHIVLVGELPEHPTKATFTPLAGLVNAKPKKTTAKTKGRGKPKVIKTGRILHLETFNAEKLERFLKQTEVQRPVVLDDTRVRVTFHRLRTRLFVTVVNPEKEAIETIARREGKFVLKDFWDENKFWGGNGEIKIQLPARQVKIWELISC